MKCEEAAVLLSGRLDGVNTPAEERELEAHLETCPHCLALEEELTRNDVLLKQAPAEVPRDLEERIMAQVRRKAAPARKYGKWAAVGAMAAAVLLVMGLGYYGLPGARPAEAPAVMTLRETDGEAAYGDETDPVALAEELGAPMVVLEQTVPELEELEYEVLPDGSLLYELESAETCYGLSETYHGWLITPVSDPTGAYALVRP